jgi:hypothetical protein
MGLRDTRRFLSAERDRLVPSRLALRASASVSDPKLKSGLVSLRLKRDHFVQYHSRHFLFLLSGQNRVEEATVAGTNTDIVVRLIKMISIHASNSTHLKDTTQRIGRFQFMLLVLLHSVDIYQFTLA